jgi:catechol 2,3-dioxygenase-like lactoylglutathione lyase family enzyme
VLAIGDRSGDAPGMFGKAIPNLPARDLDATAAMYARIGFALTNRYEGYAIIEREEVELHFYGDADLDPGSTAGMAYVRVADVDALYAEVRAAGFEVLPAPVVRERFEHGGPLERISTLEDRPWGMRQFALLDVDNNLLQIGQRINGGT